MTGNLTAQPSLPRAAKWTRVGKEDFQQLGVLRPVNHYGNIGTTNERRQKRGRRRRGRERGREREINAGKVKLFYSYIPSPGEEKRTALQPSFVALSLSLSLSPSTPLSFSPFSLSLSVDMYDGHKSNKPERVWCRWERGEKKKKKAS